MAQYNTKSQGSRVARRWFSDIDVNMTLHPESKDIVLKYDINAIKRSLKNLLLTNKYERPFKANIGADLRTKLFELSTMDSRALRMDIKEVIEQFEPRVNVSSIELSMQRTQLNISLYFSIINTNRPYQLDLVLERVRYHGNKKFKH